MSAAEEPVLVRAYDGIGHLTLNRPRAINALSHDMVRIIHAALRRWREDDAVRTVVIDGAGERGLCAGGDVRAIYDDARAGTQESLAFWSDEYRLNAEIARYPKPVVALMDGIVMGGGVGISAHARHRVVNETSVIAMPEVGIGFTPDVGGTYLLSRAPGELGTHLGLTSDRMDAVEAIYCGFADSWVPGDRRADLLAALAAGDADEALAKLAVPVPHESTLAGQRAWIDSCYSADTVEEILDRLIKHGGNAAQAAAGRLAELSPTALKVTLRAFREARSDPALEDSLERELRIAVRSLAGHDFPEGIRAQVIDRDRKPFWLPASLAEVSDGDVNAYFAPLEEYELSLPRPDLTGDAR
ncbi:MAG: 3-hydroxyisobutyryl-CoA hydrolase [Frankiales bacterium]|nr:3-hydroxyisobutyryl-CoA hydrolase [Frankiales bacterium]